MKRVVALLLCVVLLLCVGCEQSDSQGGETLKTVKGELNTDTTMTTEQKSEAEDKKDDPSTTVTEQESETEDKKDDPSVAAETIVYTKGEIGGWQESLRLPNRTSSSRPFVMTYYEDLLIEDVIADLQEVYGYTYTQAEELVFFGGLKIYSYENVELQMAVEAIFRDDSNFPDIAGDDNQPTAAVFIMDYEGRVVATVGNRGEKTRNREMSYATDVRRSPGSAIKPLSVYAPAIDGDIINYSTSVSNQPILLADGSRWPYNFGEAIGAATGYRTVQYAIQQSHNTVPAQILKQMGLDKSYNFLKDKLHFTSLEESDKNYAPLALGEFTYGVTVREMAQGYQIFGNGGLYNEAKTYALVTDADGKELLVHTAEKEQVISPETATITNRLLQKVVTQGTASAISDEWWDTPIFAETGTVEDGCNSYFAGGTPYYVGALWMGYENGQKMTQRQQAETKELWSKCMQMVHEFADKSGGEFGVWGEVEGQYYDSQGGFGSGVVTASGDAFGYYKKGQIPTDSNRLGE